MHEVYLDYLQYSRMLPEYTLKTDLYKDCSPVKFYNRGYQDSYGTRIYFGNPKSKKALVIMSGRALHNRRVVGRLDRETVSDALAVGAKITRMDVAITDYSAKDMITPDIIQDIYSKGKVSGTLAGYGCKTVSRVDIGQPAQVETVYIGDIKKRGKKGIFRAYDYQLAHGIIGQGITRLELEERGSNAHNNAKRYANGDKLKPLVRTRLDFDDKRMARIFDEEPVDITRGKSLDMITDEEKEKARWVWLFKQVAPALRKAVKSDRDKGLGDDRTLLFLESCGIIASSVNE